MAKIGRFRDLPAETRMQLDVALATIGASFRVKDILDDELLSDIIRGAFEEAAGLVWDRVTVASTAAGFDTL